MFSDARIRLILDSLPGAAAYPAVDQWDDIDNIGYLYREYAILVREQDEDRVADALRQALDDTGYGDVPEGEAREILHEPITTRIVRLTVPSTPTLVPELLARLDQMLGRGLATPEHILYLCSVGDPEEVPDGVPPDPAVSKESPYGDGARVGILDSGLLPLSARKHYWLDRVRGSPEPVDSAGPIQIPPYAGHGTFVAGVVRTMAPGASVWVERTFSDAGAVYESNLVAALFDAFDTRAEVILLPFGTYTRLDIPLLAFEAVEQQVRNSADLVLVAAAGNNALEKPFWPAAFPWIVSVGALSANHHSRASFSNYGNLVDVFAPGERLVNAYAEGAYVCIVPPYVGERRNFKGMARWSGTAFSAALVTGLIAALMSKTGKNARKAAGSLLDAKAQTIPGVGSVLSSSEPVIVPPKGDSGSDENHRIATETTQSVSVAAASEPGHVTRNGVFISYAHKDDRSWLDSLLINLSWLKSQHNVEIWTDRDIEPGDTWHEKIQAALERAKVAVLLVSPEFLASSYIASNELPEMLQAAETDGMQIFWIPVRPSMYKYSPIAKFQAAHPTDKPLALLRRPVRERALVDIVEKLAKVLGVTAT